MTGTLAFVIVSPQKHFETPRATWGHLHAAVPHLIFPRRERPLLSVLVISDSRIRGCRSDQACRDAALAEIRRRADRGYAPMIGRLEVYAPVPWVDMQGRPDPLADVADRDVAGINVPTTMAIGVDAE